ncbi:TonB-dependent receptor [Sphingomonas sp.]|uniref:TonB-dependent siderophore receptor n=1 Tax=Sphingomonas sp. TaxID=28214 RepID=UPI0025E549D6|nr:TonB-dependent receptor [Sphingomonas sp.]
MHPHSALKRAVSHTALKIALAAIAGGMVAVPNLAQAQAVAATETFQIPAGSLAAALRAFSDQTGLQMVYGAGIVEGKASGGASGTMSRSEALARILSGTGLTFRFNDAKTVIIEAAASGDDGERVLGAVRVQGSQDAGSALPGATPVNGINGSRDVTATEGTGSYTSNALTVGSKTAASIKDTPMSVSVLTSQRLQDQNITDLNTAMRNLPGVTIQYNGNPNDLAFYSRGFRITQFQFDGGAPLNVNPGGVVGYRPIIDLSLYDHVELVRGAAGTFNAYGNPGGVVNLVRKKPLDHTQMLLDMQIGSWDWHRITADVTGPLGFGGRLRGRFIATHQDNNFFYKIAKSTRDVLSASLEYDLTPTTLVSIGFNYQNERDLPFNGGLMRYENGDPLGLPRSTCLCFNFAKSNSENKEFFGQIEQEIGDDWTIKIKGTRIRQEGVTLTPSFGGTVNPTTLTGAYAVNSGYGYVHDRQTMAEATLDGGFSVFGLKQRIILGANYSMEDPTGSGTGIQYDIYTGQNIPFPGLGYYDDFPDIFHFDSNRYLEAVYPPGRQNLYLYADFRYLNAYANLDLEPVRGLHVTTSLRYSSYRQRSLQQNVCTYRTVIRPNDACFGKQIGDLAFTGFGLIRGQLNKGSSFSWPPSIQWRYDVTKYISVSAIYTDIYIDQSNNIDKNEVSLPPITGGNFEGELKWASPNQKTNASLSIFYTRQLGYAGTDPICEGATPDVKCTNRSTNDVGKLNLQRACCFIWNPDQENISYGFDTEFAGQVARGWQLSASYNFNYNFIRNQKQFDGSRTPLTSFAPRHRFQLWTSYIVPDSSIISGANFSLGIQAQSKTYVAGLYCKTFNDTGDRCLENVDYAYVGPARVILSGGIGYKSKSGLSFDLQVENILDKNYYEQFSSTTGGNWYGAPRSFKLTLHGKW